jgi:hypothetical protein
LSPDVTRGVRPNPWLRAPATVKEEEPSCHQPRVAQSHATIRNAVADWSYPRIPFFSKEAPMAMEGLWALVCAGAVCAANPSGSVPATPPPERDGVIADTLAIQTAMQQAREYLLRNKPRAAVETLERELPRINGNALYLALLRDAYRAYIKELRLAHQEALAQKYSRLLAILEPGAATTPGPAAVKAAAPAKAPTIRGYREDEDDFFKEKPSADQKRARALLEKAEQAFDQNRFRDAQGLFEQAHQVDRQITNSSRDRWAYCKLYQVTEELNQQSTAYANLEKEVRSALELNLGPRLKEYGQQLLGEIQKRRSRGLAAAPQEPDEPVTVRHLGRQANGWQLAETANFRIFHSQDQGLVEQVARAAEQTRARMHRKWFGGKAPAWNPKCDLVLYATAQDYTRATGVPSQSPGHSSFNLDGGRVLNRRIELHCDVPEMLTAVLPHETTHVVLAGNFGDHPVPRWADEGIAVLTEPRDKIERHLRRLPQHWQDRQLFNLRQLVNMNDYPPPQQIPPFYAQSVSLVEFLSQEKGPQVLTQFVRDGLRDGYDTALQRHYGYRSFEELERSWSAFAFKDVSSGAGVAQGGR